MLNASQLARLHIDGKWVDALNETFERFAINSINQQACFIGQCSHESGNFRLLEENLNYKAVTLTKLWPKRFPTLEIANKYAGQPRMIANKVYSSRMGNRDEASNDGWMMRGRGLVQLTGSDNYHHASKALGVDLITQPDLVATPKYAALTAGWFWQTHKCGAPAEALDHVRLTKIINGGVIGLDDRIKHTNEAIQALSA